MNKIIYTVNPIITKETFVFSYKFEKNIATDYLVCIVTPHRQYFRHITVENEKCFKLFLHKSSTLLYNAIIIKKCIWFLIYDLVAQQKFIEVSVFDHSLTNTCNTYMRISKLENGKTFLVLESPLTIIPNALHIAATEIIYTFHILWCEGVILKNYSFFP